MKGMGFREKIFKKLNCVADFALGALVELGIDRPWEPGLHRRRVLREGRGNSRSFGGNLERLSPSV